MLKRYSQVADFVVAAHSEMKSLLDSRLWCSSIAAPTSLIAFLTARAVLRKSIAAGEWYWHFKKPDVHTAVDKSFF